MRYPMVVHSHLPWDGVWQRPQQFFSRFAKSHPVLFVEGPVPVPNLEVPQVAVETISDYPDLSVVHMQVPKSRWHEGDYIDQVRKRLLKRVLAGPLGQRFMRPIRWFYDPMAVTAFGGEESDRLVVYDCMDQLSQFKFAPPEIVRRELELLELADLVFAGGPKLHESKRVYNDNCHCFGCGVDVAHFGKAQVTGTEIPGDVAHLNAPVLGYFGVVDERIDYELVDSLAQARKDWQVVIIGPTAKVDPQSFPQRPNLHWLGRREYAHLPAYCKRFAACLMPFAIGEATEFINPTKALEYMATGRPIVSTPVEDVVRQFDGIVSIGRSHQQFIEHCQAAVEKPNPEAVRRGLALARSRTWEAIVQEMEKHMDQTLFRKESGPATAGQQDLGEILAN